MAQKKPGQKASKHYVSRGKCPTLSRAHRKLARADAKRDRFRNQFLAWKAGKRVILTIPNPDPNNTRERFIRVEATKVWGKPSESILF